jgi:cell division protein FtsI (penicillin-binding protein 3)
VAGTTPPRSTPQLIEFHPQLGRRVISPLTAAEMKRMMAGVVLRGTGPKAILDGYSSAGKTGTAQKIDASGRYSHHVHIASFAGFAPVNNPAITVLAVFDSPATYPHDQGGDVAAPVFSRVAQQVLAYLNVPHDVDLRDPKHLWARAHAKDVDSSEAAPDYIASQEGNSDSPAAAPMPALAASRPSNPEMKTIAATSKPGPQPASSQANPNPAADAVAQQSNSKLPEQPHGTVVLDVAGGVLVPDFKGKSLRAALEEAESAGIELEVSGSGVGQTQTPIAGSRIPPGGHVAVAFGR